MAAVRGVRAGVLAAVARLHEEPGELGDAVVAKVFEVAAAVPGLCRPHVGYDLCREVVLREVQRRLEQHARELPQVRDLA
jgi:hypothetical protein